VIFFQERLGVHDPKRSDIILMTIRMINAAFCNYLRREGITQKVRPKNESRFTESRRGCPKNKDKLASIEQNQMTQIPSF